MVQLVFELWILEDRFDLFEALLEVFLFDVVLQVEVVLLGLVEVDSRIEVGLVDGLLSSFQADLSTLKSLLPAHGLAVSFYLLLSSLFHQDLLLRLQCGLLV